MSVQRLEAPDRLAATFVRSSPEDAVRGDSVDRVTIIGAARMCAVRAGTVHQWVITGLWPLPCAVWRRTYFFERSDVEQWMANGVWPDGAHFRRQRAAGRGKREGELELMRQ
jgi:hypothetical protein